ncbi:MAG: hypothetical protein II574_00105 [Ruminococcus sp.]|nr:hypothetical protein [Ruminococcus sp.]
MKRSAAMILAAALVLSMAGCGESKPGTDISAVPQVTAGKISPDSSEPYTEPASLEMTDGQELVELLKYTDFYFNAKSEVIDEKNQTFTVYEGVLNDSVSNQKLYERLCGFIKNSEIPFKDTLDPTYGIELLTLKPIKTKPYLPYTLYKGTVMLDEKEKNVYILRGPHSTHYLDPSEQDKQDFEQFIKRAVEFPENIIEESGGEKLTPAPTTIDDLVNYKITSFEYSAKVTKENTKNERISYYEGSIEHFSYKKDIYSAIYNIVTKHKPESTTVKQKLSNGDGCDLENEPVITLTNTEGGKYTLCKGTIYMTADKSSTLPFCVITSPDGKKHYYKLYEQDMKQLTESIQAGICNAKNFIKDEYCGKRTPDASKKLTAKDLAYINLRTNYAEGTHITGYYVSKKGELFRFDFSELERKYTDFNDWLLKQIELHSQITDPECTVDAAELSKGLEYAAKIDPNAKVTEENKMFDYGQSTAYAIVDGRFVMLWSKGDNDLTVNDANVPKATEAFDKALRILNEQND